MDNLGEDLTPAEELELMDLCCREAAVDEEATVFDPDEHPKPPHMKEEAVTDDAGERIVDVQRDTPLVDNLADFDLSDDELNTLDAL